MRKAAKLEPGSSIPLRRCMTVGRHHRYRLQRRATYARRGYVSAMPELAEVEYYRRQWDSGLGQKVVRVQVHAAKRIFRGSNPRTLVSQLAGKKFLRSTSWGKQMLFEFAGGSWLGIHLGMTGTLRVE